MTDEMVRRMLAEILRVCAEPGFGEVAVVIEKGRPRRLRVTVEPWLEERTLAPPPARAVQMA